MGGLVVGGFVSRLWVGCLGMGCGLVGGKVGFG